MVHIGSTGCGQEEGWNLRAPKLLVFTVVICSHPWHPDINRSSPGLLQKLLPQPFDLFHSLGRKGNQKVALEALYGSPQFSVGKMHSCAVWERAGKHCLGAQVLLPWPR